MPPQHPKPPPPPPPPPPPAGQVPGENTSIEEPAAQLHKSSPSFKAKVRRGLKNLLIALVILVSIPLSSKAGRKVFSRILLHQVLQIGGSPASSQSQTTLLQEVKQINLHTQEVNSKFTAGVEELVGLEVDEGTYLLLYDILLCDRHQGLGESADRSTALDAPAEFKGVLSSLVTAVKRQQGVIRNIVLAIRNGDVSLAQEWEGFDSTITFCNLMELAETLEAAGTPMSDIELEQTIAGFKIAPENKKRVSKQALVKLEQEGALALPLRNSADAAVPGSVAAVASSAQQVNPTEAVASPTVPVLHTSSASKEAQLALAIKADNIASVGELLKSGADANCGMGNGEKAIIWAVRHNRAAVVDLLVQHGVNVNIPDATDNTALLYAAFSASPELIDVLLKAGADSSVVCGTGLTPLMQAIVKDRADAVKKMLEYVRYPDIPNDLGQTALMIAARSGNDPMVRMLLEKGANANATDSKGNYVLYYSVEGQSVSVVKQLLKAKADKSQRNKSGQTAFNFALNYKSRSIVNLLRP